MNYTAEQIALLNQQTFAFLNVEENGHVLTLTLDRAAKKNALHPVLVNELVYSLAYAHYENHIRVVVLKAEGNVFCAGADLKAFMGGGGDTPSTIPEPKGVVLLGEVFNKLHKPCIAQVEGDVYAGGFLLLCGCTHVVAAKGIRLGLPEVKRGLFPFQVMASLIEIMPARKVLDWCVRGYDLPAEDALRWGLVTHLAEADEVAGVVAGLVADIAANSPTAIRNGLAAYDYIRSDTSAHHAYLMQALMDTLQSKDAREGIRAFKEKRPPVWTGE